MLDAETKRFIQDEIRRMTNIILSGQSGSNTEQQEDIINLYPGMNTIEKRPVSHPYGYASRSTPGTIQVTGRQGEHVGNRIVLGHRDKNKPTDLGVGESVIYSSGGLKVYMRNDKIQITSENANNPAVLFDELKSLLESILSNIQNHTHTGNQGIETSPPLNAGDFSADSGNIDTIASGKVFLED